MLRSVREYKSVYKEKMVVNASNVLIVLLIHTALLEMTFTHLLIILGIDSDIANNVSRLIYGCTVLYISFDIVNNCNLNQFRFVSLICGMYLLVLALSIAKTPNIQALVDPNARIWGLTCLPLLYMGKYKYDKESAMLLVRSAPLFGVITFFLVLILISNKSLYDVLYMPFSYAILPCAVLLYVHALIYKRALSYLAVGVLFVIIFIMGSRGALISLFVAVVASNFADLLYRKKRVRNDGLSNRNYGKRIISIAIWIIVIILSILTVNVITDGALQKQIIESRTYQMIKTTSIININSPRAKLFQYFYNAIISDPMSFRGIYADRVGVVDELAGTQVLGFTVRAGNYSGMYAHNIVLELFYQFGIILGSAILMIAVLLGYCYFQNNKDECFKILMLIVLSSMTLVPLLVSGSYLEKPIFWFIIGVIIPKANEKMALVLWRKGGNGYGFKRNDYETKSNSRRDWLGLCRLAFGGRKSKSWL